METLDVPPLGSARGGSPAHPRASAEALETAYTRMVDEFDRPSPALRAQVWNARIEADMRQRYFSLMAQRASFADRGLRIALVFFSSAAAGAAVGVLPFGSEVLAVLTALLAAVAGTLQLGSAAASNVGFAVDWGHIHNELDALWIEIERYALAHDDVHARLRTIQHRHESIDRQSTRYRINPKLLSQCFDQAEAYAGAS